LTAVFFAGVFLIFQSGSREKPAGEYMRMRPAIPPDDIFLPLEPDFIPGVILERPPRAEWTQEHAALYWQDPLKSGEEPWRERIEVLIDQFMENVP
jgi:hypothetical protein